MDDHRALVDVLLLPDCNLYERYPELVQRVDYFLYEWCEEMLARTASLLRRQEQRMQKDIQLVGEQFVSNSNDVTFAHKRSTNIVWRQWAVSRLQLPQYPPEQINWNKDADPAFLYGQVPELRLEVPWSARRIAGSGTVNEQQQQQQQPRLRLKSALKRTDLQTFLTSPTLSPASSPLHSPMYSPAVSIRENMSTSSFGSEDTLEDDSELKPRLRFNDRVEQCMVVFDQEKECLPTDDEDDSADEEVQSRMRQGFDAKRALAHKRRRTRTRRSLVIKLAPTQLKGDHRRLVAVAADAGSRYGYAAYCDSEDDDPLGGCDDAFAMLGERAAGGSGSGVGSYVQGYVQTVAGQVRRFVSDAVMVSSFAKEKPAKPPLQKPVHDSVVADPYANHHAIRSSGGARWSEDDDYMAAYPGHDASTRGVRTAPTAAQVVRDPFSSASTPQSAPCDRLPFDDEDAIIQEFEREMHKCSTTASSAPRSTLSRSPPPVPEPVLAETEWSVSDADNLYGTKYHLFMDDDDDCEFASEFGHSDFSDYRPADVASRSTFPYATTSTATKRPATIAPQQQVRNESIIDRAEDTIVNTVDAVKWCASFISNYTIF
ncbi:hypothetical protein H4S08_000952 [Coemansia sp. RSA 1365]|nr:hypothetical protein H4S08_000952 [Coemansia sp. RSA 1365]